MLGEALCVFIIILFFIGYQVLSSLSGIINTLILIVLIGVFIYCVVLFVSSIINIFSDFEFDYIIVMLISGAVALFLGLYFASEIILWTRESKDKIQESRTNNIEIINDKDYWAVEDGTSSIFRNMKFCNGEGIEIRSVLQ